MELLGIAPIIQERKLILPIKHTRKKINPTYQAFDCRRNMLVFYDLLSFGIQITPPV